jgi:hypothetical protein
LNKKFTLHHKVFKDGMEYLELQQREGLNALMKYVEEFNAKLTLEPIKKEFTKMLAFL